MTLRHLILIWLAFVLLLVGMRCAQAQWTNEYDPYFQESSVKYLHGYLPDDDWRWFKAQCIQESRLVPDAESWAGAVGVCQLMPESAQDAGLSTRLRVHPRLNIRAGAFILRRNILEWWPRPTRMDRLELGWASYNAGAGNIIDAQRLCDNAALWGSIAPCLFCVTGENSKETLDYVRLIPRWYEKLTVEQ